MYWLKRNTSKVGIAIAGLLLLLLLMVWVPMSANAYTRVLRIATPVTGTVQVTPTVDATMTVLSKEQLTLQVKQIQNQLQNQNNWVVNNSTALIAAVASVVIALFGILQWAITVRRASDKELRDREDERRKEVEVQEKNLKAQAEERFKTAVAALGDEKEGTQIGGAILLRSFLNPDDKKNYERYYTQVFDLAVAYLRLPRTSHLSENPDGIPHSQENPNTPLPLTALNLALIIVFKEAFPLARDARKRNLSPFYPRSLDAFRIKLDGAYLAHADLSNAWMREASLRGAWITEANLCKADLRKAYLTRANLTDACLEGANFRKARLEGANFLRACLKGADLSATNLRRANLSGANLSRVVFRPGGSQGERDPRPADLSGANPEAAQTLEGTDLHGVIGLTKEQLEACNAKGAIIDDCFL